MRRPCLEGKEQHNDLVFDFNCVKGASNQYSVLLENKTKTKQNKTKQNPIKTKAYSVVL